MNTHQRYLYLLRAVAIAKKRGDTFIATMLSKEVDRLEAVYGIALSGDKGRAPSPLQVRYNQRRKNHVSRG